MPSPGKAIEHRRSFFGLANMISVIIPTYNEATYLPATLDAVANSNTNKEVIVVDAGSADGTSDLARARAAHVLLSQRQQRAYQMNLGASHAYGAVLLFHYLCAAVSAGWSGDDDVVGSLVNLPLPGRSRSEHSGQLRRSDFFAESPRVSDSGVKQPARKS